MSGRTDYYFAHKGFEYFPHAVEHADGRLWLHIERVDDDPMSEADNKPLCRPILLTASYKGHLTKENMIGLARQLTKRFGLSGLRLIEQTRNNSRSIPF